MEKFNQNSRIYNSFLNFITGFGGRIISIIISFAVRTVFIKTLGQEYLGINGLYSNILSVLSLSELGFSTAMVFSMYKPLADGDAEKLSQLLKLYKKVYSIIGTVVLVLGLALVPFLDVLIKNKPDIDGLTFYYILFLLNSVISYWFFAYRNAILQADQKSYIINNYQTIFNIVKSILQIILLVCFKNFTAFLIIQIVCTIAQNIALAVKVKKTYPIFDKRYNSTLPKQEKTRIFTDVRALMLQRISFIALNSTDSLIISAFVGINWVGLLSNYTLIIESITNVLCQITSSVSASIGNFFSLEDKDSGYSLFKRIYFLNYWVYSFSTIALFTLLNPFIELWLGNDFLIPKSLVIALVIRFLMDGYINTLATFRSSLGLFVQGKYLPIIVAISNVLLSISLSYVWGAFGVIIATPITRLIINAWHYPYVLHKYAFNKPLKPFYFKCLLEVVLIGSIMFIMNVISNFVFQNGVTVLNFIIMMIITVLVPNLIMLLLFFKSDEFNYFKNIAFGILNKIRHKN